ncbi:MAG: glycosyltransferase family 4 protein [Acidobacteriota bacterium]|jgi:mannosyltransferase|nr:glycosyltransferase family 4 protein [Acidobacteriota bacterium]
MRREIEVVIPNFNHRFSGVTAAAAAVVPHQAKDFGFAQISRPLGAALGIDVPSIGWGELLRLTARPLPDGRWRIFHARRNVEMLVGLLLRRAFRRKLLLVFTSVAQRRHSAWTRFLYSRMDALVSTSPRSASFLSRPVAAIVPHGVDTDAYRPSGDRGREWAGCGAPGRRGVGIFGRVRPQKGVEEFVDALCEVLPRHPDVTAVLTGEVTPEHRAFEARLKGKIRGRGLEGRFLWLGKVPAGEVRAWLRRVSLAVAVPRNEGFGLTALEAMSSGTPVVATRTGAFDLLVRDGVDGILIPCAPSGEVVEALRDACERLLSSPGTLERMGAAARRRACESFSIQREAEGLNAVYRGLFGGRVAAG